MAFNLPGILGRNNQARQDRLNEIHMDTLRRAKSDVDNAMFSREQEFNSKDASPDSLSRRANNSKAKTEVSLAGTAQSALYGHKLNAVKTAKEHVSNLKEKSLLGKGEERRKLGEVSSAKKDAKALAADAESFNPMKKKIYNPLAGF